MEKTTSIGTHFLRAFSPTGLPMVDWPGPQDPRGMPGNGHAFLSFEKEGVTMVN